MIDLESLPKCPTCGAVVVAMVRCRGEEDSPRTTPRDQIGWACGAAAKRTLRMMFDESTFPNGKFATYSTGPWSTPAGCRNAEEVVRRMLAERAKEQAAKVTKS